MNNALADHPVEVRQLESVSLLTATHTGSYMNIGRAFAKVFDAMVGTEWFSDQPRMVVQYCDDPKSVPERLLRSRAGIVVEAADAIALPLEHLMIPGGRCAVLRYRGPYASMHAAYQWFFGFWLLRSGETPADRPVFEKYLNNPVDTAPQDLLTDIYMPLMEA